MELPLTLFPALVNLLQFSSYVVSMHSLDILGCAWFIVIFFCSVQLISFGGLPFSQMKQRGNGFMGERVGGSPGKMEGEETLGCFIREEKSSSSWFFLRSMSCLVSDFQTPGSVSHLFQLIE